MLVLDYQFAKAHRKDLEKTEAPPRLELSKVIKERITQALDAINDLFLTHHTQRQAARI